MKIYQMIYTSVLHSISDSQKGLSNQAGRQVYSCSEGLMRENINELIRFCSYRILKGSGIKYSDVPCDPTVPELFPKMFRTLKLADGRYAAIQIVYSGRDFKGDRGNSYAHALVFDEVDEDFFPEQYYNSPLFTTYLTKEQQEAELIKYLPEAKELRDESLDKRVEEFILTHRTELSYILNKAVGLLTDNEIRNICIATDNQKDTDMYLVSLKYLLPRDVSRYTGISTYNVYMPSDKQFNIVFHGTVKGLNNITSEAIAARSNCLYIDMDNTDFINPDTLPVFNKDLKTLRKLYGECRFTSVSAFLDWCDTYRGECETGIGAKLMRLNLSGADFALRSRLNELYPVSKDNVHKAVSFEIAKILYDNSEKLPSKEEEITKGFIGECIDKLCTGEEYPLSDSTAQMSAEQAKYISGNIREYMAKLYAAYDNISEFNQKSLVEFFAILKHASGKRTWRDLFLNDKDMLTVFVSMSARQVIKGSGIYMFELPKYWENRDLSELVAFIDSSTEDESIKYGCLKYILTYPDEDWYSYGITVTKTEKTKKEEEEDLRRVKQMLKHVGYMPFERAKYDHLRTTVRADISDNLHPLLLSRVLNAYYNWRASAGHQTRAQKRAEALRDLILELRDKERAVYNFVIPKLAIEIIEAPGHYHEKIINPATMPESFWNWFIIGFCRCRSDDGRILNYSRVYLSHKSELDKTYMGQELRDTFKNIK